jgi:sugar phosphate isomerase/epimerase
MHTGRLAAWLDSYRVGLREGLEAAAGQGYRFVQANSAGREFDPREFSASARRDLGKYLQNMGLQLDALALDYPGVGLADPTAASERVDRLRAMLDLCVALRVPRAAVSLSGFEDARTGPLARELLGVVADLADRAGVDASISGGADAPAVTAAQVRLLGCPRLHVALDTARLPGTPDAVIAVADTVGAVTLRDVRRAGEQYVEVPFGEGDVDFVALLGQLQAAPVAASLVVRHDAAGGVDVLKQGREYMASLFDRLGIR